MKGLETIQSAAGSRVLCISNRLIDPVISRCLRFEFEDVVASVDHVDLVGPKRPRIPGAHWRKAAGWIDARFSKGSRRAGPGRYELLFFGAQMLSDLAPLIPWSSTMSQADVRACYIEELYTWRIGANKPVLEVLKQFDAIFVSYEQTVEPLARATGRPCYCVPASIDALELSPFPDPPARVIDFYSMGRRPQRTHEALLRMAERSDWFYHFDTVTESRVSNHAEHRRRLADLIKRSKYFLVNPALCNVPEKTAGQRELAFRYFEGAACGTVMIGDLPDGPTTNKYMGWRDCVIPLAYDSGEIEDVIRELESDPERVDRIRKSNVVHSLRLNDHVHRWGEILRILGLPETPEMERRRGVLNDLADQIERTMPPPTPPSLPSPPSLSGPSPAARAPGSPPLGRASGVGSTTASPKQPRSGAPLEHLDSGTPR